MEQTVTTRDRGEATMWLAIATPIVMMALLALIVVVWVKTNIIVALVLLGAVCAAGYAIAMQMRRRTRGF